MLAMLDAVEQDSAQAEVLVENTGTRRCELQYLADHEMIVKLEDYLRRVPKSNYWCLAISFAIRRDCRSLQNTVRRTGSKPDEYFCQPESD